MKRLLALALIALTACQNANTLPPTTSKSTVSANGITLTSEDVRSVDHVLNFEITGLPAPSNTSNYHWIALTKVSEPDDFYLDWTSFLQDQSPSAKGRLKLSDPVPGDYELRLYLNWPAERYVVALRKRVKFQ